jgi:hypothetical protein
MKTWNTPEIQELNLSNTAAGSAKLTVVDYKFKDQDGHIFYSYSGTGDDTDNRKDIVDPVNP